MNDDPPVEAMVIRRGDRTITILYGVVNGELFLDLIDSDNQDEADQELTPNRIDESVDD